MKKIFFWVMALTMAMTMTMTSCSDVDIPEDPSNGLSSVQNLTYEVEGRSVTLSWVLPTDGAIKAIYVIDPIGKTTELEPDATSYFVPRAISGKDINYTVKVAYEDGRVSHGNTITLFVEAPVRKIAYITEYASIEEIEDDDERASAEWFAANYPNGEIMTATGMPTLDPEDYSVVWMHIDRVGIGVGYRNLPKALIDSKVVSNLKKFLGNGGNILLTNHATQYITPLGRIAASFAPGIFGDGEGSTGDDVWTINAIIGHGHNPVYDHSTHPIFAGMETNDQWGYPTFPLIGPGQREDHNCMWDFNSFNYNVDGSNNIEKFEKQIDATVLATWGQVTDYACAGLIEFNPNAKYQGTVLAIGLAAYEWNQNSGANPYQSNIEKLTKNSLEYLSSK